MTVSTWPVPESIRSIEDFRRRAAERANPGSLGDFGDHHLNPDARELLANGKLREAAVLVPIVDRPEEPTVLLTRRTKNLRTHSGQVAFPGGRIDPEDHDAVAAAIRECDEEIGIGADHIEVVGRLPEYVAGTGFRIVPVLSVIRPDFTLVPNPHEVDAVFEVPLGFLMSEANHVRASRLVGEKIRYFYEMPYGDWYIWGVTAGIIRVMYERLYL